MDIKIKTNSARVYSGKKVVSSSTPLTKEISSLENLGEHIKYKRTSMGLSIGKTSALCGISDKTLRLIENGKDTKVSSAINIITMLGMKLVMENK